MKKIKILYLISILLSVKAVSQTFITEKQEIGSFPVVSTTAATAIYTDEKDSWLVQKATSLLQQDIESVTGKKPVIVHTIPATTANIIIIGSIDNSAVIRQLIEQKKLNVDEIKGKWEGYRLQLVKEPVKGIKSALVITGSDRRGVAFGVFELSEQIGVSPWYWWADVPVKKKNAIYMKAGTTMNDAPAVKYRGIFINDEAPAFSGWTKEKFGGVNHQVYERVFELLLRMKANYLWPAMWGNAFNDDDTLNPVLADNYGIVMGTSHHEPMLRAQQEWKRYGKGSWNYQTNDSILRNFWRKGIQHMGTHESIVTIGMRGDGDEPMTQGTAIELLEQIVKDQRQIIQEVSGKSAMATPQMWALYKEVQDYYDKGMRVPDDVTLLLCDDNWGNLRKLPRLADKPRPGGYGIYYHFDYVGGPRNYKWINTNQIERTWEQMHLAYEYGVDKIWIVNVGDLKPMEFPINFFLDYAWKPQKWTAKKLPSYYLQWAEKQFGSTYAQEIAGILAKYTKYNSRRKPELLTAETYSLNNYGEADRVAAEYQNILEKAEKVNSALPKEYKDAFYELVLHPVQASTNLMELYLAVAKNRFYAQKRDVKANALAEIAKQLYLKDSLISRYYNDTLANGKWRHMMDQTHIGYTYWQQPQTNTMPELYYVNTSTATNIGNRIDSDPGREPLKKKTRKTAPTTVKGTAFVETEGYIAIEAAHFSKAVNNGQVKWQVIPNLGRTASAITTVPVTAAPQSLSATSPHVEYTIYVTDTTVLKIHTYLSPTLNFHNEGLRYAISIDDEKAEVINMHEGYTEAIWNKWVADNIIEKISQHNIHKPGLHVIKFWRIDPAVVLQKIVVDAGGLKSSYLGPEETKIK